MSELFSGSPNPRVPGLGYGTAKKAISSIKKIKRTRKAWRKTLASVMYNRAKYNKNQTPGMRSAMKIYKTYLKSL
ncbi:MAG: hypothetical protein EBS86_13320 [Crocinitomicaceae bacterium]|nr:hypothetical protein [Crocinitomicaceae bacterium]